MTVVLTHELGAAKAKAIYHGSHVACHGEIEVSVDEETLEYFGELRFRGITPDGESLRRIRPASLTFF